MENIIFFLAEGELYCNMADTVLTDEVYSWLATNSIDLGRRSSFSDAVDSPLFTSFIEAESWLAKNGFQRTTPKLDEVDPTDTPTEEDYQECARISHQINEIAACARLSGLLPHETDHSFLCSLGVWYWSIGHKRLAVMAYRRSIELKAEAATYFNMAVCLDDLGETKEALQTIRKFYEMVPTLDERTAAERMLVQSGKGHLLR